MRRPFSSLLSDGSGRGSSYARGLAELEPIGIVDIGSNSVRLVVYDGAVRAPTPLFNEKDSCKLGRSIASTGRLDEDSVASALATLSRFRAITRVLGVKNIRAFATAAAREASNGAEFLANGERAEPHLRFGAVALGQDDRPALRFEYVELSGVQVSAVPRL